MSEILGIIDRFSENNDYAHEHFLTDMRQSLKMATDSSMLDTSEASDPVESRPTCSTSTDSCAGSTLSMSTSSLLLHNRLQAPRPSDLWE